MENPKKKIVKSSDTEESWTGPPKLSGFPENYQSVATQKQKMWNILRAAADTTPRLAPVAKANETGYTTATVCSLTCYPRCHWEAKYEKKFAEH